MQGQKRIKDVIWLCVGPLAALQLWLWPLQQLCHILFQLCKCAPGLHYIIKQAYQIAASRPGAAHSRLQPDRHTSAPRPPPRQSACPL